MSTTITQKATSMKRLLSLAAVAALTWTAAAQAAAPGISGTSSAGTATAASFALTATQAFINQPDGNQVYSWGYGCSNGSTPAFVPASLTAALAAAGGTPPSCSTMQIPGPTLVVTQGARVTVTLTNMLPSSAGPTSIIFSGQNVAATGGAPGLLTTEAGPGGTVTYTFTASRPGTFSYYSGTQSDLQVEMGMYGALIVLPSTIPTTCTTGYAAANLQVEAAWGEADFRLPNASGGVGAAYNHPDTCYDREYLFQFSEMDLNIHRTAYAQVNDPKRVAACGTGFATLGCPLEVPTEPYHPGYYLINGRSMPDDMDPNYDAPYPHQPYNGNPHMHPGELTLIRVIGTGRWEHPFHEHANHVRILARDGNLILSNSTMTYTGNAVGAQSLTAQALAGLLMFTTDTFPGQSFDGIFYFTAKGLNWDAYAHNPTSNSGDPAALLPCYPDANGYYTTFSSPAAPVNTINYFEWCQDHNKPLEANPFGDVSSGGPMTLPNPNIFTNGAWYGGSPYLGPDATVRGDSTLTAANGNNGSSSGCLQSGIAAPATGCTNLQPANTQANPANERGWAFMWHSHNEREITTNNVFPGGMLMMMLVDSREFVIDESK
jgi:FtsP/CotA-like multicopper oxidase with cupredoxin domain